MNASQVSTGWSVEHSHETRGGVFGLVHRLLRGRYLITLVLAAIFATIGGLTGFMMQSPLFRSDSVIKIEAALPKILYETEQASAPRMFSSFVNTQAQLMRSNDVVERAMASDRWRGVAPLSEITTADGFKSGLRVTTNRAAQELIFVSYEHEDARVAQAANQAIVEAYMDKHGDQGRLESERTMGILQARREALRREKDKIDSEIRKIVEIRGTDRIGELLARTIETIAVLEAERTQLQMELDAMTALADETKDPERMATALTEERAAELDPAVRELIGLRTTLESQRAELIASGVLRGHRLFRQVESGLEQVNAQIHERLSVLRESILRGDQVTFGQSGLTVADLQTKINQVSQRLVDQEKIRNGLFQDDLNLRDWYTQRGDVEKDIAFVETRITAIETESQVESFSEVSGRITIASEANMPRMPSSDKRIKLAGAGFVGGAAIPIGAMLMLGMVGRRIRYSDDGILEAAHSRIVGVLPDLGQSITDRELAEASAFAVHQVRSQLQMLYGRGETSVFSVTSPAPGDGKTSMIIALGLSFAESGDRTLLVDLDLIGRGLSLHFGHPNAPSLADAAASGADLIELARPTSFERLSILPAGMGDDMRISKLSPAVVRRLIDTFRDTYDTVLIDSGPILGSIEAGLLAPATDGMLMVVGRGQLRPLVKRAVDQIQAVGGQVIATVFNRASVAELRQSSSSMSVHFSRQASRQAAEQAARGGPGVGPLAGSLFSAKQAGDDRRP